MRGAGGGCILVYCLVYNLVLCLSLNLLCVRVFGRRAILLLAPFSGFCRVYPIALVGEVPERSLL
jgi:hypothetical protein